jgi:two-component system NtrC family response regulator
LLTGPTGSGKELVARAIHAVSRRKGRFEPLVVGGATDDPLLESTLFGHVRGAFTGADSDKPGVFGSAQNGTVFLDEIGDLPPDAQVKLLRVLQERTYRPVGGAEVHSSARVICATHVDLAARVAAGKFREDLYYRLKKAPIRVPSLEERRDDIPVLAQTFAKPGPHTLSEDAIAWLTQQPYPGNVRQLDSVVCALQHFGDRGDLADAIAAYDRIALSGPGVARATPSIDQVEQTVADCGGNVSAAARRLRIDRSRLNRLLAKTAGRK